MKRLGLVVLLLGLAGAAWAFDSFELRFTLSPPKAGTSIPYVPPEEEDGGVTLVLPGTLTALILPGTLIALVLP